MMCNPTLHESRNVPVRLCLRGGGEEEERKGPTKRRLKLRYWRDELGFRVYTASKIDPNGFPTFSAHPPPFHPSTYTHTLDPS
eukprot:764315-Hanusia_phi.AAC.1